MSEHTATRGSTQAGGRRLRAGRRGFTLIEVVLVLGILGVLSALATPTFLTYLQAARLRVAAEQVASFLNLGRQLGIKENVGVCVLSTASTMQFRTGSCAGTVWVGPGTDSAGNISLPNGISLSTTGDPVFNYLGAASAAVTYTVRDTQTNATRTVTVSTSGRVAINQ